MPLWFMSFGGTIPVGNLVAGPAIDHFGARPVLLVGAAFARLPRLVDRPRTARPSAFLPESEGGVPFEPMRTGRPR